MLAVLTTSQINPDALTSCMHTKVQRRLGTLKTGKLINLLETQCSRRNAELNYVVSYCGQWLLIETGA